ncbi:MAG: hypothetical protein KGN02_10315 [bacterium]|nr:hypothetical protein [bacterium]
MASLFRLALVAVLVAATATPAFADQDRGHGAIYYSPSGHRIGYARSLPNDDIADHVASAMCQGGQLDADTLNAYSNHEGGASATGSGPDFNTVLTDCRKLVKFTSTKDHQCGGFGYSYDNRYSKGTAARDRRDVNDKLSNWPQKFVVCNDDRAVSGFERFMGALSSLANDLNNATGGNNGGSGQPVSQISFTNTTNTAVGFGLKCPSEATYHQMQIAANATQSYDASSWGGSCGTYNVEIVTNENDGSVTKNDRTVNAGGPYSFVFNGEAVDLGTAPAQPLTVINDTQQQVYFTFNCPGAAPATLTINAGGSVQQMLGCSTGAELDLNTGTQTNSTTKIYSVANGQTWHIQVDPTLHAFTLVKTP